MDPTDILHATQHPDPYPWYGRLADDPSPLPRDDRLQLWIAVRPDVVRAALDHPHLHVRPVHEPVPTALAGTPAGDWFGRLARMNDGADAHAAPRAALMTGLARITPDAVDAAAVDAMAGWTDDRDWTCHVPMRAVARLLGFAPAALDAVVAWSERLAGAVGGRVDAASASAAAVSLRDALGELVDGAAADSAVAAITQAPDVSRPTLLANLAGLMTQTCDATAGLLGNAVVACARGADTTDVEALVAGVLAADPPIHHTRRFAARSLELAGQALPAGATVVVVLVAAETPFGAGRHGCPGEAIARRIVRAALRERLAHGAPWPSAWGYREVVNARIPRFEP